MARLAQVDLAGVALHTEATQEMQHLGLQILEAVEDHLMVATTTHKCTQVLEVLES